MKIIFRTNAGKEGLGHINRVYSLYLALSNYKDFKGIFIVNEFARRLLLDLNIAKENIFVSNNYDLNDLDIIKSFSPEIIIIDTYKAAKSYYQYLYNEISSFLVLFDDNIIASDINVDIIINGNLFAENLNYKHLINYKKSLLGPKYLVMNREFWDANKDTSKNNSNILITCGGADPVQIMPKLINWTRFNKDRKKVVIGPYFEPDEINLIKENADSSYEIIWKPIGLKKFIEEADIVITASGSTVYEVLTLKKLPIIFIMSDDQILVAKELEKWGVISLGWYENINQIKLKKAINKSKDKNYRLTLNKLYSMFDGKGTLRVAEEIISYYKNQKNIGK